MKKSKNPPTEETKEKVSENKIKKANEFTICIYNIWCKKCGICVAFCPNEVLGFDDEQNLTALNPKACIGCRQCELRCPDYAIEIKEKKEA